MADADGDKGRVLGFVLVADAMLEKEFCVGVLRVLLFLLPGLHWHPRAMPLFPTVVLFTTLGFDAALSFLVLEMDFIVGFVLLEFSVLMIRAVAVGFLLVVKMVVAGVKEQNLPLSSSWGSSTLRMR